MKNLVITLICAVATLLCNQTTAAESVSCQAKSPAHRVALIELYTSEGCNSCPPADAWLRGFSAQPPGAAQAVVPIAFHVDYWNSIGWTDRFSDHRYTERQNMLAGFAHSRLIYTPEVFVNGHELRQWSGSAVRQLSEDIVKAPADAEVVIDQEIDASGRYRVSAGLAHLVGQHGPVALQVALYQSNLTSAVKAGENEGVTLHHAFAARALSQAETAVDGRASVRLEGQLPLAEVPTDLGFVAFAQDLASGDVLEAVAVPACSR